MQSVFISSTFRDMQSERDMMHTDVIPALNALAEAHHDHLHFIDLRWGVNTNDLDSDESAIKVLNVCLDEIDKSQPYMLIFIGDRYGWIPDAHYIQKAISAKTFEIKDPVKSVTALEIEYGLLSRIENADHCIVCMRRPIDLSLMRPELRKEYEVEGDVQKMKLDILKYQLETQFGDQILYYDATWSEEKQQFIGLEPLRDQLIERFKRLFATKWGQHLALSWQEHLNHSFEQQMKEKAQNFCGHHTLLLNLQELIFEDNHNLLLIKGEPGVGKSSLLCKIGDVCAANQVQVMPFFVSQDAKSTTIRDLLFELIWWTERQLQVESKPFPDDVSIHALQSYLSQLLTPYTEKTLLFLLDDIDLLNTEGLPLFAFLPDSITQHAKWIFTANQAFNCPIIPETVHEVILSGLNDKTHAHELIETELSMHHKSIDSSVLDTLLEQGQWSNPLYLKFLVQRLLMMNSHDLKSAQTAADLNRQMVELVSACPSTLAELSTYILDAAGHQVAPAMSHAIFMCLAISPYGLRERDIEALLTMNHIEWSTLDFTRLSNYLRTLLCHKESGFIDFQHRLIREHYLSLYEEEKDTYLRALHTYILTLDYTDRLRQMVGLYTTFERQDFQTLKSAMYDARMHVKEGSLVASQMMSLLRQHGIELLLTAFKSIESDTELEVIIAFICDLLYPFINQTDEDLALGVSIFESICLELSASHRLSNSPITLSGFYNRMSGLYLTSNLPHAPQCLAKCTHYAYEAYRQKMSVQTIGNYFIACYKEAFYHHHNQDSIKALELLESAFEIYEFANAQAFSSTLLAELIPLDILASKCHLDIGNEPNAVLFSQIGLNHALDLYRTSTSVETLELVVSALSHVTQLFPVIQFNEEQKLSHLSELIHHLEDLYRRTNHVKWLSELLKYKAARLEYQFDEACALGIISTYEKLLENQYDLHHLKHLYQLNFKLGTFYYQNQRFNDAYTRIHAAIEQAEYYLNYQEQVETETIVQIAEMNRQMGTFLNELDHMEPCIQYASRAVQLHVMLSDSLENHANDNYALCLGCLAEDYAKINDYGISRNLFIKQLSILESLFNTFSNGHYKEKLIQCLKNLYVVHIKLDEESLAWEYRRRAEGLIAEPISQHRRN